MKYTIKEFSDYLGITTDTLRLYEKHGIVKPMKDEKNSYRYFDDLDARQLLSCRFYRSLDFPLKEAAFLTLKANQREICNTLEQKKKQVQEEIERLKQIEAIIELTHRQLNEKQNFEVKRIGTLYRFAQTHKNTLISDVLNDTHEIQAWMEALPEVMYTLKGDLISDYTWGMAMPAEVFERHHFVQSASIEVIPASTYLTTVIESPYEEYVQRSTFEQILKEAEERGLEHRGFIMGRLILTAQDGISRKSYIEWMLPLKEEQDI